MRPTFSFSLIAAFALAAGNMTLGQDTKPPVSVDVKLVKVTAVPTPQFAAANVPDKRWRPKNWLEIDVDMVAKKAKTAGDASTVIEALEIKYFIGLNHQDASKKNIVITGTMNVMNIPAHNSEHGHALAFVSPATLVRLLESNNFNPNSDIKAIGVEVNFGGQPVGYYSHPQSPYPSRWWIDLSKYSPVDGVLLPKIKTPFAPLWGDYDVEVKQ